MNKKVSISFKTTNEVKRMFDELVVYYSEDTHIELNQSQMLERII